MNSILQWEPEKSRLWGSARIENVHRIRDDLARLAEWIKIKADAASLTSKADAGKLAELEKSVSQTRVLLEGSKKEAEKTCSKLEQQLVALDQWIKTGGIEKHLQSACDDQLKTLDALGSQYHDCLEQVLASARQAQTAVESSVVQCREIEQTFTQAESTARNFITESLGSVREQAELTSRNVEQSKAAAELTGALRLECEELTQGLSQKADALSRSWEAIQATLTGLSIQSEEQAGKAVAHAQAARETLSECQTAAQHVQHLRSTIEVEQKEASERLAAIVQQAETQATAAQQSSHLSVAASDLAAGMKSECENLTHSLRLKADELGATWEGVRQTLTSLSLAAQQHAGKATEAVNGVSKALAEAQVHTEASLELRASLKVEQEQIGQRLNALDEMLEQVGNKVNASAEHVQACDKIRAEIGDTEVKLQGLRQTLEDHLRQSKQSREDVETVRKELRHHISSLQLNSMTFGRRLRWLFFGNQPSAGL